MFQIISAIVLRRLLLAIPTLLLLSLVVFVVLRMLPVDPLAMLLPASSTPAKLVEAAQNGKLAGPLLYSWVNSTGDPENYAGRIFDPRLRFSTWKDMALAPRIDALMTEVDEAKRMAGYKALNVESSEQSWAIPLLQAVATVAYSSTLQPTLFDNGYILPADMKYR